MRLLRKIAIIGLLVGSFMPLVGASDVGVNVRVVILKVPRVQSWEEKFPDGCGGTMNVQVNGDATVAFPHGVGFLQTELSHKASGAALIGEIRDRASFGNGYRIAKRISIEELKRFDFRLDESHPSTEARFEKEISSEPREDYRLRADLKSTDGEEIIMKISFDSGWRSFGGRLAVGMIGTIFDQTVILSEHKFLLIGFRSWDQGPRGAVYWIAIAVARDKS